MAPDRLPYFPFYPQDFIGDGKVQMMDATERGIYISLLCHEWSEGAIPDDPDRLARVCGTDPKTMKEAWSQVRRCFVETDDGRLVQARLEEEREEARRKSEQARQAAEARWSDDTPGDASASADAGAAGGADAYTDGDAGRNANQNQSQSQKEETETEGEDSSLRSSSSPPQGGTDDKSDHQDDDPLDLTELDSVSGEDLIAWVRGTPASESAPTAYWVDGVRELWWGQDEDPVGHGVGATMRYLTTERQSHSDSHMDGSRFIVGCYLLRERGELMGLDPGEPFGRGLLLEHDKGDGRLIWYRALEAAEELERKVEDPGEALRDMDIDLGGILGEGAGDGR